MTPRKAAPADTPALKLMMQASNGYERPAARAMIKAFAEGWSVPADDHEAWVLEADDGAIAGFYQLIPHTDAAGAAHQELDLFFTSNAHQGTGVGRKLFAHMRQRARDLGARRVIISSNPESAGFYRRMGALDSGVTPPGNGIGWERPRLVLPTRLRRATVEDAKAIAILHRLAMRTDLPWLPELHTPAEDLAFFRDQVVPNQEVWVSTADDGAINGYIALKPGWIAHLDVHPAAQGKGVGSSLILLAKARANDLQLWTFQGNARARGFYEARDFRLVRLTDGAGNEEKTPDALYAWHRSAA
ncbi:MAG: family N-acetyltransferase [Caulobacter sp.]|nr:family N-acetyltransferase [Caulobacter sp.]